MKRLFLVLISGMALLTLVGCGQKNSKALRRADALENAYGASDVSGESLEEADLKTEDVSALSDDLQTEEGLKVDEPMTETDLKADEPMTEADRKTLVAYFSCTGITAPLAKYAADALEADLYEIVPAEPYTADDIAYNNDTCRANKEQADDTCRPKIAGDTVDMSQYETVVLAFPIWWGKEPRIIDTFMNTYDFSGKSVLVFCTSGGSGVRTAAVNIKSMAGEDVTWLGDERFDGNTSQKTMEEWLSLFEIAKG